jgi:hypothetical protein
MSKTKPLFTLVLNDRVRVVKRDTRNWTLMVKRGPLDDGGDLDGGEGEEMEEGWTALGFYGSLSEAIRRLVTHRPELFTPQDKMNVQGLRRHLDEVLQEMLELAQGIENDMTPRETRRKKSEHPVGLRIDRGQRPCHTPLRRTSMSTVQIQVQELEARMKVSPLLDPSEVYTLRSIHQDKKVDVALRQRVGQLLFMSLLPNPPPSGRTPTQGLRPFLLAACNIPGGRGTRG